MLNGTNMAASFKFQTPILHSLALVEILFILSIVINPRCKQLCRRVVPIKHNLFVPVLRFCAT